ncbi:Bifunctional solanapyrone synthase 1 [Colletotrichum chlorophyti]|uniref:Bifunctional solanapyrone synthase 1 n=1 Tax=Colletotrichum chlorophyti TaxID=708187 RepID=A0A1Q8S7L1_9PEZI|nr:Bifunctional solanapyrone synthase 1 [Colletotrichum chlorophyti]
MSFPYRQVLLVGATSGIGAAMADKLVSDGVKVVAVGRRQNRLDAFVEKHGSSKASSIRFDITDKAGLDDFVSTVMQKFPELDCVFINSGTQNPHKLSSPESVDLDLFRNEVNTNFLSVVDMSIKFLPKLQEKPFNTGLIITGTHIALVPAFHLPAYSASKAALSAFVYCLRKQLQGSSTRVVEIWPPMVQTELHDYMGEKLGRSLGMPLQEFTEKTYEHLIAGSENIVCDALSRAGLADQLYFPKDVEYTATIESYYSGDVQDVTPRCILQPETTQHVADALKALSAEEGGCWTVAIRSGGHSPFPSNNAAHGVTIDLGRLSSVTYTDNSTQGFPKRHGIASVGAGGRWGHVYTELEKYGVMVTGAREGHVGVGGFLLGGGFSWHSGKYGFTADNVVQYEVVLANGSVDIADATRHPDLFKALKGGTNNIGIVTRFDLRAFLSNDIYGGVMAFPYSQNKAVLQKFVTPPLQLITANVEGVRNSTSFVGLEKLSPVVDIRTTAPVSTPVQQLQGKLGLYNVWFTLSFHATTHMGNKALQVFEELIADLESQIDENINVIFLMTPLPMHYANRGPNILGLDKSLTEPSIVLQVEALLPSPKYGFLLTEKLRAASKEIALYSEKTNERTSWQYVNYAHQTQDPLGSYCKENEDFLERVSQKYDPSGFFQRRVPGGFKISNRRGA